MIAQAGSGLAQFGPESIGLSFQRRDGAAESNRELVVATKSYMLKLADAELWRGNLGAV